jgi:SMI1 / KNR4 family (SUKH-1)
MYQRMLPINEINQKLQILRESAFHRSLGPDSNKFELNSCLSQDEVQDFETQHKVSLPDDYKQFLLELGNGGAGPHYGLAKLQNSHPKQMIGLPWTQEYWNNEPFNSLSKPFPYTGDRDRDIAIGDSFYDKNGDEIGSSDDIFSGMLIISHQGCSYWNILVINGRFMGEIWEYDGSGANPEGFLSTKQDFKTWYMTWLNSFFQQSDC